MTMRLRVTLLAAVSAGCATSRPLVVPGGPGEVPGGSDPHMLSDEPRPAPPPVAPPPPAPVCTAFARPGVLRRSAVTRTVEAGLGRWLGGVQVDPGMGDSPKRFRGWIIKRLYPGDACYRDVDLAPGDLVLRLNGRSIEKPEEANEVWSSLLTANAIVVELVRDGKPRKLFFPIVDE